MLIKEKDIIHYIDIQFEKLEDLVKKSANNFNKIQIHRFRVQVKKLRAFLRLLQSNPSQKKKLKIPGNLKKIYRAAGEIRNIQNHRSWIKDFFQNKSIPKTYLVLLKKKLNASKQKMNDSLDKKPGFQKKKNEIESKIEFNFDHSWLSPFFDEKKATITRILAEEKTDAVLHLLRKTLKDLDYTEKWIRQLAEYKEWKSRFAMKELIELLGKHQDYTIHENFLSSDETAQLNGTDKMLVEEAYRAASENKAMLKEGILLKIASH